MRKGTHVVCILRLDSFSFILGVQGMERELLARKLLDEWFSRDVSVSNLLSYFIYPWGELLFFRGKVNYLLFIRWVDDMVLALPLQGVRWSRLGWPHPVASSRHSPKARAADVLCRNLHVHPYPLCLLQTPQCSEFGVCRVGQGLCVTDYKVHVSSIDYKGIELSSLESLEFAFLMTLLLREVLKFTEAVDHLFSNGRL